MLKMKGMLLTESLFAFQVFLIMSLFLISFYNIYYNESIRMLEEFKRLDEIEEGLDLSEDLQICIEKVLQ